MPINYPVVNHYSLYIRQFFWNTNIPIYYQVIGYLHFFPLVNFHSSTPSSVTFEVHTPLINNHDLVNVTLIYFEFISTFLSWGLHTYFSATLYMEECLLFAALIQDKDFFFMYMESANNITCSYLLLALHWGKKFRFCYKFDLTHPCYVTYYGLVSKSTGCRNYYGKRRITEQKLLRRPWRNTYVSDFCFCWLN
jgi:hypothetical protein